MDKYYIRNTLFGFLMLVLLAGSAQDLFAQRRVENRNSNITEKKEVRKTVKKDKVVRSKRRESINKDRHEKDRKIKRSYSKKSNQRHKQEYRHSKKDRKYKKNYNKSRRIWNKLSHVFKSKKHDRKPSWVDYHRRGHHYPVGTRFLYLPRGYISFHIGGNHYFSYQGTYYRYNPIFRAYVVIEKPIIKTVYSSSRWDRITLTDGSTIEGIYLSGDDEMVLFEVGDAVLEIPLTEIRVLSFSEKN